MCQVLTLFSDRLIWLLKVEVGGNTQKRKHCMEVEVPVKINLGCSFEKIEGWSFYKKGKKIQGGK